MAAKKPEKAPEKAGSDVNQTPVESSGQEAKADESAEVTDFTDEDLAMVEKERSVPYNRFKEVNEEKNAAKQTLEQATEQHKMQMEALAAQYEARMAAQKAPAQEDYTIDYGETVHAEQVLRKEITELRNEIGNLKGWKEESSFQSEMGTLKNKYPEADTNAVLGWKKVFPSAKIEALMQKSHDDNKARVETTLRRILDEKKNKAKNSVISGSPTIKLKESERPKTLSEATKAAKEYFKSF